MSRYNVIHENTMAEVLNISEIETLFADEWELVQDPQTYASNRVQGGTVRFHS